MSILLLQELKDMRERLEKVLETSKEEVAKLEYPSRYDVDFYEDEWEFFADDYSDILYDMRKALENMEVLFEFEEEYMQPISDDTYDDLGDIGSCIDYLDDLYDIRVKMINKCIKVIGDLIEDSENNQDVANITTKTFIN